MDPTPRFVVVAVHGDEPIVLSRAQSDALVLLAREGGGAEFDPAVMSDLFTMGLVEVHSIDRRLVLTETGRLVFREIIQT